MKTCSKKGCENPGVKRYSVDKQYCLRCYRITIMVNHANQRHPETKVGWETCNKLLAMVEPDMLCPHCQQVMTLHGAIAGVGSVASLQHYDDGRLGIICHRCNARHGPSHLRDKLFTDIQAGQKYCPHCRYIKNYTDFNSHQGVCRECSISLWRQQYWTPEKIQLRIQ